MEKQVQLVTAGPTFGCDPEFFFKLDGEVIGAEKVIPAAGVGKIIIDGVQAEINSGAHSCRANLGNDLRSSFINLKAQLARVGKGKITASFSSVVNLSQKELDSLSEKARVFGCAPSINKFNKDAGIKVNAATYMKRAAGGHIHIGGLGAEIMKDRSRLVPILDILLGNTCVMIDRDPGAAERRLHYGRAGEYREPVHGLEYRTLSNFWLRSYQLMSFVTGVARLCVAVLDSSTSGSIKTIKTNGYNKYVLDSKGYYVRDLPEHDYEAELLSLVKMDDIITAINTNDLALAKSNWKKVKPFVKKYSSVTTGDYAYGLPKQLLDEFDYFCMMIEKKGIEYWFPQEPLEHWCNMPEGHGRGWESFLSQRVAMEYQAYLVEKQQKVA